MKQPKDPLKLPKPAGNTRKIANKLMAVASGNLICHVAKVKAATSTHSMADVMPFLVYSILPLNSTLR